MKGIRFLLPTHVVAGFAKNKGSKQYLAELIEDSYGVTYLVRQN